MTPARPYTPDELAARWECSAETVRGLVKRGQLRGFRVGRMIRIPRDAVEEYEGCSNTGSDGSRGASSSPGTKTESAGATVLRPQQLGKLTQRRAT